MSKQEDLIKAAMKLFVEQGFENTPTAQISREANVATGTLFRYFKSKEELINATYMHVKKSMATAIGTPADSTENAIKKLWFNLMKWGHSNYGMSMFLARFYGSTYINTLTQEQSKAYFEQTRKLIDTAKKKGILKDLPKQLLESLTMSIFQAFLNEYHSKKLTPSLLQESFDVYWSAVKA